MLRSLRIQNYALISELDIDLHRGFSVITGETGAGKSILLGAIGLLLGQRADSRMIKSGTNRCVIEATFDLTGYGMNDFFIQHELDFDGHECIIRRELTATGKSRAFINDTPAQVGQLRELGDRLIDIHSQHQNLLLSHQDFQLRVLDILAHNDDTLAKYNQAYDAYQQVQRQLRKAEEALTHAHEDEDYLRFQLSQIDAIHLLEGQQADYEQEAQMLEHAEEIKEALWSADNLMQGGDSDASRSALDILREVSRKLEGISSMLSGASELSERLDTCLVDLKDIAAELSSLSEDIDVNPQRLETVNNWLSELYSLQQKHHVNSEKALIALREDFRQRLNAIDNSDEHLKGLQEAVDKALASLVNQAVILRKAREKAAKEVEQQMQKRLVPLGISNVRFQVEMTPCDQPRQDGMDQVRFLFCANKSGQLQPISEVASGGEIARVMLSLKALISASVSLPTIVFDEIDTGVSGHIAESMARTMREMGNGGRQVIAITHLPQIAALGTNHYRVYKEDDENGTASHIVALTAEERITEIAHMLSGSQITKAAIENAKSLLQHE